jgi:hypothetical protein
MAITTFVTNNGTVLPYDPNVNVTVNGNFSDDGMSGWYGISYGGIDFGGGFSGPGVRFNCGLTNCQSLPTTPPKDCLEPLLKNRVGLALDAAGVAAGFVPEGSLAAEVAEISIGAAATVNSAIGGDLGGSLTSIFGIQLSALGPAAKWAGTSVQAIPVAGALLSAAGALNDLMPSLNCMAGH